MRSHASGCSTCCPSAKALAEDAVLVADAVADRGHAHGGERVDEARGQATEAAVAEPGLDLDLAEVVDVDAALGERLGRDVGQSRGEQVVVELAAQQVFGGEVAHGLRLLRLLLRPIVEPPRHEVVADRVRQGQVLIVDVGGRQRHALVEVQVLQELFGETVDGCRGGDDGRDGQRVGGTQL
ncbi:hypothetical protein QE410_002224 [Microbacterium sp. SORGH_AS 1204]|nr:hypothetical protein [Microbacterium sp. SORGH_AS_1204]